MNITEKNDEIILRDYPFANWIYGMLSMFGFILFMLPVVNAASVFPTQTPNIYLVFSFILAMLSLYWAWGKFSAPIIITRFKLSGQIVDVTRIKFPLGTQKEIYEFARIKRFETVQRKVDRSYLFFNVMILTDGECVDLESSGMIAQTNRIPSKLNELVKTHREARKNQ